MKNHLWLTLFLFLAAPLIAQERVQRVVEVKRGDVHQIFIAVRSLGGEVTITSEGNRILLAGPKPAVDGTEALVRQLDVAPPPKKNLDLTVFMVAASTQASSGSPLPDDLSSVAMQLKSVFPYKGFRLIDSFVLRARLGEGADTSGFIGGGTAASARTMYTFKVRKLDIDNQSEKPLIRLDGIRLGIRVPVTASPKGDITYVEAGINTDVDLHEGQKVVVGKTSALDGPDGALFLVISAKVVN